MRRAGIIALSESARLFGLSDQWLLHQLETDAASLWPALPSEVGRIKRWLSSANSFVEPGRWHAGELRRHQRLVVAGDASLSSSYAHHQRHWNVDALASLVEVLRAFSAPGGAREDVAMRLHWAKTIEERSVSGASTREAWARAIASIMDSNECPRYNGLEIRPQVGLLPLDRNPGTGLWEFLHLASGERPSPASSGSPSRWEVAAATGVVLVLIPGGTFSMSADVTTDPLAHPNESPVHRVEIAPFFLSKFELTKAQWSRLPGAQPSLVSGGSPVDPVSEITGEMCGLLERVCLTLPSEAQWEYACRAGTDTAYWSGSGMTDLQGVDNVLDRSALYRIRFIAGSPELEDGFVGASPVGSFRPNPFGLHDVHGNVQEWCADLFSRYGAAPSNPTDCCFRGGSFRRPAPAGRSASRWAAPPTHRAPDLGVRPAFALVVDGPGDP